MLQRTWMDERSLENFRDWLSVQDPEEKYTWSNCQKCPVAEWHVAMGHKRAYWAVEATAQKTPLAGVLNKANELALYEPWTFGALYRRVKEHVLEGLAK
jgi:hypothetical protein